ncbi:hypothetical protein D3C87_2203550 [compost metagenome]
MYAQCFSVNGFEFQTHEITGVERVVAPSIVELATIQNGFGAVRAAFHDLIFLLLLNIEFW